MLLCLTCILANTLPARPNSVIRTAAELASVAYAEQQDGREFQLTARITSTPNKNRKIFTIEDETGPVTLSNEYPEYDFQAGESVEITGITTWNEDNTIVVAQSHKITLISRGPSNPLPFATIPDLLAGKFEHRPFQVQGTITDAFIDEIDPEYIYFILKNGRESICLALRKDPVTQTDVPYAKFIGSEISTSGIIYPREPGCRRNIGKVVALRQISDLNVLRQNSDDPFAVPDIKQCRDLRPQDMSSLGRHKTIARVIAAWNEQNLILKTIDGAIVRAELANPPSPVYNQTIEISGFPETDLFRVNLTRCVWRGHPPARSPSPQQPLDITAQTLFSDTNGHYKVNASLYGRTVRIKGNVSGLPVLGSGRERLYLESDNYLIPVEVETIAKAITDIRTGCCLEITGTCVMELENWRQNAVFPRIRGVMIVPHTPDDIRILAQPPWWTPMRLMIALATLAATLLAIAFWNFTLQRTATRKGRELLAEQIGRVESDLKTEERTRLAIELHDSLSQTLASIALELKAIAASLTVNPKRAAEHLGIADKSLFSCRQELRNCLQDLRSDALGKNDLNEAIAMTLGPHISGANMAIRFNIPRERLTDNTTHALLRIIRELVMNAINHGHATDIKIAGAIENGKLLFSVRDNGCGFDPNNHLGVRQGHFGLQGIRERIQSYEGMFIVESPPGHGVRATIVLHLPHEET